MFCLFAYMPRIRMDGQTFITSDRQMTKWQMRTKKAEPQVNEKRSRKKKKRTDVHPYHIIIMLVYSAMSAIASETPRSWILDAGWTLFKSFL